MSQLDLRPLRLHKPKSVSSLSSPIATPKTSLPSNATSFAEFQIKPIRLGSSLNRRMSLSSSASNTHKRSSFSLDKDGRLASLYDVKSPDALSIDTKDTFNTQDTDLSSESKPEIEIKYVPDLKPVAKWTHAAHSSGSDDPVFAVCVVDFHHQHGPEVLWWKSNYVANYNPKLFLNLPFQALPDGLHLFEETFSNFNLVYDFSLHQSIDNMQDMKSFSGDLRHLRTLFGCSCVRQVKTSALLEQELTENDQITRLTVQKAIVVISRNQPVFTKIKEKLAIVTRSFFEQQVFSDKQVLNDLFENLNAVLKSSDQDSQKGFSQDRIWLETNVSSQEEEFFVNLELKTSILAFKDKFLSIFKAMLLNKRIIVFSNENLEMLTQFQNNLISLVPNLINNLDACACPLIDYLETNSPLEKPSSLNTNQRKSLLRFFGLPLQVFNTKDSFWNPYLPLQQLDELSTPGYMIGCSNLLFLNQATTLGVDMIVNLDTNQVLFPQGDQPPDLSLSPTDKKFINNVINNLNKQKQDYLGNDDYIRHSFEEYLNSLVATMRYVQYRERFLQPPPGFKQSDEAAGTGNINLFHKRFIASWKTTRNYEIWNAMADDFIFNFSDPRHVGAAILEVSQPMKIMSNFFGGLAINSSASTPSLPTDNKVLKFIDPPITPSSELSFDRGASPVSSVGLQQGEPKKGWRWGSFYKP